MFNIGTGEIALIAVAALIILGPSRLPELARGIGKFMREFRRQTDEVRNVVEREFYKLDQEVSIHESVEAPPPPVIAANAVPRGADPQAHEPDPALPPGDDVSSQLTAGTPPTEPVEVPAAPPKPDSEPSSS